MPIVGNIISISNYIDAGGNVVGQHPFIVVDNTPGYVHGRAYNIIAVACSSYKNSRDKFTRGLIDRSIVNVYANDGVVKDSFVKCGTLVYFNDNNYKVVGDLTDRAWLDIERKLNDLSYDDQLVDNINNI